MRWTEADEQPQVVLAITRKEDRRRLAAALNELGLCCLAVEDRAALLDAIDQMPAALVWDIAFGGSSVLQIHSQCAKRLVNSSIVYRAPDRTDFFDESIAAMKLGACEVLAGPLCETHIERMGRAILKGPSHTQGPQVPSNRSAAEQRTSSAARSATRRLPNGDPQDRRKANVDSLEQNLIGISPAMRSIRRLIAEVAETRATVSVQGESGTGKELVAQAIHNLSARRKEPFVPVNMAAIPQGLAESLLFGHEKGAFTSATNRQVGWCEAAHRGTLLLDEIGELELAVQPKLLRFLQEGTLQRVGSHQVKRVDVRIVTATHCDMKALVNQGRMRQDLYFRLHVVPIEIPPLRQRPEDIPILANEFLRRWSQVHGRNVERLSDETMEVLSLCAWPGNVRQLENTIERMVIFTRGKVVEADKIPTDLVSEMAQASLGSNPKPSDVGPAGFVPHLGRENDWLTPNGAPSAISLRGKQMQETLTPIQWQERALIVEALRRVEGHVVDAARLLKMGQATVYRKIRLYRIARPERRRKVVADRELVRSDRPTALQTTASHTD